MNGPSPARFASLLMIDLRFYTANILDVLKKYQIRATIFIVGSEAKKIPGYSQADPR